MVAIITAVLRIAFSPDRVQVTSVNRPQKWGCCDRAYFGDRKEGEKDDKTANIHVRRSDTRSAKQRAAVGRRKLTKQDGIADSLPGASFRACSACERAVSGLPQADRVLPQENPAGQ
jgi:hypothetical protein